MFLHNIALQERAIAADGLESYDLGVNPLSVVLLCLRPLNDTGTLSNFNSYRGIAAAMNRMSVLYRGEAIKSIRGEDLVALNFMRWGVGPWFGSNPDNTDNERRCCVIPIMMGRWPYLGSSCFPATRRGELTLEIDWDIADTGYDGMRFSVETVELLDAKPTEYEKWVQVTQTNGATGDQDMDLVATGNLIRGILLFGTTGFAGASPAPSWGRIKVLLDNQEAGFSSTDWEVVSQLYSLWGRQSPLPMHGHTLDASVAGITSTTSVYGGQSASNYLLLDSLEQYAFLDYDPTGDDAHALKTSGKSRLQVRANVETADAVRAVPIEVIKL